MEKRTLIIADLHGKYEIVEKALNFLPDYNIIFLGDYLDDYHRSIEDQLRVLNLVLDAARTYPEQVQALLGNHELSYIDPLMRCSGHNSTMRNIIRYMDLSILKPYIWAHGFLLSHAGVSQTLLDDMEISLEQYLEDGNYNQIGRRRGGTHKVGGLYWCDWSEFEPIDDVPQIVGHSGGRDWQSTDLGVLQSGNSYNADCYNYKKEFILLDDSGVEIIEL